METNNSLGIIGRNVQDMGRTKVGYAYNKFEIDGKIYMIKETDQDNIDRLITIFKNDEFKGSGSGIYTYVIGTQFNINVDNKTISRYEITDTNTCDVDKMNIWLKKSVTIQEIESKHATIINNLLNNYDKIVQSFQSDEQNVDPTLYHDNAIDQLYYSGELRYNADNNSVDINFLSGTYMAGIIDCSNPPEQTIKCIKQFFSSKLSIDNVNIDTSCESYVTQNMTIEQLNQYVNYGIPVYIFHDKKIAQKFSDKNLLMSKLKMQIAQLERTLVRVPSDSTQEKMNNLKKELSELESLTAERYYPSSSGGKYTKRRKYIKHKKTQKHKIKKKKKIN